MAAARWAPVIGLLLLLPLLPSASSSPVVLQLTGSVYPVGHYYVTINVGDGEKVTPYFFDIDTGSKLTWLECDAGHGTCETCNEGPHGLYRAHKSKLVPCENPICDALHKDLGSTKDCRKAPQQCDYRIRYADESDSIGVLLIDKFSFRMADGTNVGSDMAFGCGYDQVEKGKKKRVPVDGMLGLGRGSADLVSQLKSKGIITKNMITHCLATTGGYLLFGDLQVPERVTWVPMAPKMRGQPYHYSPGQGTLQLNERSVDVKPVKVVFDSGSTYTYLPPALHDLLVGALKQSLGTSLVEVEDPELSLCWKRTGGFKSLVDLRQAFKSVMSLKFENGATMMIPPENYLIITRYGNACLGMLKLKTDKMIIGDITMQHQLVIYDNENGRLGWMRQSCMSKSASAIFSRI